MAERPEGWVPLSLREIERKPKRIIEIDGFYIGVGLTERQMTDFVTIQSLIKTGGDLAPYYRRSHNRASDKLLVEHSVMHLHLGGPGSNALLYLVQFPADVLLLCVDSHVHVDDIPPGKKLPFHKVSQFVHGLRALHEARRAELARSLGRLRRPRDK